MTMTTCINTDCDNPRTPTGKACADCMADLERLYRRREARRRADLAYWTGLRDLIDRQNAAWGEDDGRQHVRKVAVYEIGVAQRQERGAA